MRFVDPSMLIWSALLVVPIVLYLVRPRPRQVRVSTLPFFKVLARAYQESSWMRRLKQFLSLLLSLLVILGAAFALAHLVMSPPAGALKSVVVLVDRSASMQAAAGGGGTRLEQGLGKPALVGRLARRHERDRDRLRSPSGIALIAQSERTGDRPARVQGRFPCGRSREIRYALCSWPASWPPWRRRRRSGTSPIG